jgi:hypothetical protein
MRRTGDVQTGFCDAERHPFSFHSVAQCSIFSLRGIGSDVKMTKPLAVFGLTILLTTVSFARTPIEEFNAPEFQGPEVAEPEELKYPPNSIGFRVAALEVMYDLVAPAVPMSDARPAEEGNKSTTRMLCELSALRWTAGSSN